MYFNGEQYGNHASPHSRKLPWEKTPRHILLAHPTYNHDDMMPFQGPPSPNATLQAAMAGVHAVSGIQRFGQHVNFNADLEKLQRGSNSPPPLTTAAIAAEKIQHHKELQEGYQRGQSTIKTRLRAAAYTAGGTNYYKLFRFYDRDNSGLINEHEFMSLCRKDGKVTRVMMTDKEIFHIFRAVDTDGSGEVSHEELISWITGKPTSAFSSVPASKNGAVMIEKSHNSPRSNKKKIGELKIGIGRKPGSNLPEKKITLIIRQGDQPGPVVHRLRKKFKQQLMKGQADHIVEEIKHIISNQRRGSVLFSDTCNHSPKRNHKKVIDETISDVLLKEKPQSNNMVFGRRLSTGDRGSYLDQEKMQRNQEDREDARHSFDYNDRDEINETNVRDSREKFDLYMGIKNEVEKKMDYKTMQKIHGYHDDNYITENNNDVKEDDDWEPNTKGIEQELDGTIQKNVDHVFKIKQLEIALAKSNAENMGLRAEVQTLRAALTAFASVEDM